jgi:hypothetical protein
MDSEARLFATDEKHFGRAFTFFEEPSHLPSPSLMSVFLLLWCSYSGKVIFSKTDSPSQSSGFA